MFNRAEEALIRNSVHQAMQSISCPRCGDGMELQAVPPRPDVAYVRDRLLLVCSGCGRSLVMDRKDPRRSRSP